MNPSDTLSMFVKDGKPLLTSYVSIVDDFRKKIRSIQEAGRGLDPGEMILMINKNFGYSNWSTIPWGEMEKCESWLKHNWFRNKQLLDPENHNILMAGDNPYSAWFKKWEPLPRNEY